MTTVISQTDFPGLTLRGRGKVRDIYDLGDKLLIVATDRLSAFDVVLPTPIPDKGKVLTQISLYWFETLAGLVPNHVISGTDFTGVLAPYAASLRGRGMVVKKTEPLPVECVVRGYISGSGWKDYQKSGAICGIALPKGLRESDKLPEPIFTPSTKATTGRDENISFSDRAERVGVALAERPRDPVALQRRGRARCRPRHHHRRHEIRISHARRRTDMDRRSAHARFLALLAGRSVRAGQSAAFVRQAVRPRLFGTHRLEQTTSGPGASAGRRLRHAAEIP